MLQFRGISKRWLHLLELIESWHRSQTRALKWTKSQVCTEDSDSSSVSFRGAGSGAGRIAWYFLYIFGKKKLNAKVIFSSEHFHLFHLIKYNVSTFWKEHDRERRKKPFTVLGMVHSMCPLGGPWGARIFAHTGFLRVFLDEISTGTGGLAEKTAPHPLSEHQPARSALDKTRRWWGGLLRPG